MLNDFFQLDAIPANSMTGWYDFKLVILSYIVAVFASYIALDLTARLRDINNTRFSITMWLLGGALAMGAGIWSMHFIGMLAFNLPMPMTYDYGWTVLSMLVAVGASWFALYMLKSKTIHSIQLILGGIILGFAIAAMHYTGMEGMMDTMDIRYLPGLFALSIVIAIFASEAALYLAIKSTQVVPDIQFRLKLVSALVMGAAICGMHYTGMFAAVFTPKAHVVMAMTSNDLNQQLMAISVATVTFIILSIAFIASTYKESLNQQLLITARQAGMAEVAASVLHNVGNVLNSVNVSSTVISEKIQQSKLSSLTDLKKLVGEHKENFVEFIEKDPRGSHLPEYICSLADYWEKEQNALADETKVLIKNIDHIKNIIATQQDISRNVEVKQLVSLEHSIDEAILISGIDNAKYPIKLKKEYARLSPILTDKVKLLQILVNLIQNAKDSLLESTSENKLIILKTSLNKNYACVEVIDNGIGILPNKLTQIFAYGYTTKISGHGFGLHTSAIYAKEMGGTLVAKSEGKGKGANFVLELPNKN